MNIYDKNLPIIPHEEVLSYIAEEHYYTLDKAVDSGFNRLRLTTVCVLILKNGFVLIGTSATNNADKFDFELGKKYAKEKAINELWGMLAFQLRTLNMLADKD